MKEKFKIIATIAAVFSVFPFLRSKSRDIVTLLWLPKLLSGAFSLWLAIIGVISTIYGWMRSDRRLILTGSIGTILSLLYIRRTTIGHYEFERAFGYDWENKINQNQRKNLQPVRWPVVNIPVRRVHTQRNIVFGTSPATGEPLLADLWLPSENTQHSGLGLIYIHGGAWRLGTKDMGTRTFFQRLASLGHLVMDIDYTLWPKSSMTDMVREVKLSIDWMKENAGALCVNPDRVVLMGGSAGAHLALLAGYTPDLQDLSPYGVHNNLSVRGIVAFYPPVDFRSLPEDIESLTMRKQPGKVQKIFQNNIIRLSGDFMRIATELRGGQKQSRRTMEEASLFTDPASFLQKLIGGSPEEIPEAYSLLSPAAHVCPDCPPTLLLQGTDDYFQLLPGVQQMHHSLKAAGATSILVEFPHCEHAFDLIMPQISPAAQAATYDVERFLALLQ